MKAFTPVLLTSMVLALVAPTRAQNKAALAPTAFAAADDATKPAQEPKRSSRATTSTSSSQAASAPSSPGKAEVSFAPTARGYVTTGFGSYSSLRDGIPPVVVQFSEDAANVSPLEEDLTVMTRIIDKALERGLGEESPVVRAGIPLVVTSSGRASRALYIEGFGALFMIKVNFPLLAPPMPREEKQPEPAPAAEWNDTKEELFPTKTRNWIAEYSPSEQYNQTQVDTLKRELVNVLKQGTNIRHLKPEDFVSFSVFGQPSVTLAKVSKSKETRSGRSGSSSSSEGTSLRSDRDAASVSHGTVLTVRAKKSDIDAFAAGKLDYDQFKGKAIVAAYNGSGYGITSVNSWVQSGRSSR